MAAAKPDDVEDKLTLDQVKQLESIMRIFSESIEKLKVSMLLPMIFENPIMIGTLLSGSEYERCLLMVGDFIRSMQSDKPSPGKPLHFNYRLIKIIDYFHEHVNILEHLPDWLDGLDKEDKIIIKAFENLQTITEERLTKSAWSELNKEKKFHELYHANQVLKKNIAGVQQRLTAQQISLRWRLAAKDGIIQKYQDELSFRKYDNNMRIKQEIIKSSRSIRQIHAASSIRQRDLQEELERTKASYEKQLKEDLKQEKIAKDEKNKLFIQLRALIQKYETTMGEKMEEGAQLQLEYDRQKALFDEFMIEYNREEEQYNQIVRIKEDEERAKRERKILLFVMNRAARIIQKAWRRFKRASRKKGKKGKRR